MLRQAAAFFGPSIELSRVRVQTTAVIVKARPWTNGNTVRFAKATGNASCPELATMIHELAHVWQHQSGQTQLISGAVEQLRRLLVRGYDPYDFGGPEGVRGTGRLQDYSKESQAQIVQNYWRWLQGSTADTAGRPFTPAYAADLQRLVEEAGIGLRAPAGSLSTTGGVVDSLLGGILNGLLTIFGQ
jgi:hypothetical protein